MSEKATEWYLGCYGNAFDPDTSDERYAKPRMSDPAKRRAASKAASANRKPA